MAAFRPEIKELWVLIVLSILGLTLASPLEKDSSEFVDTSYSAPAPLPDVYPGDPCNPRKYQKYFELVVTTFLDDSSTYEEFMATLKQAVAKISKNGDNGPQILKDICWGRHIANPTMQCSPEGVCECADTPCRRRVQNGRQCDIPFGHFCNKDELTGACADGERCKGQFCGGKIYKPLIGVCVSRVKANSTQDGGRFKRSAVGGYDQDLFWMKEALMRQAFGSQN